MPIDSQLTPHEKDLGGGFTVRRLLPAAVRQAVGPFVFFDHFGPSEEMPDDNHDVRPHPHIGLSTVTYLFEGAITHRDNLGCEQEILPGAINWMTAGRGIVHSERRPERLRGQRYVNHGLQLWLALPAGAEDSEASFRHTPADAIPQCELDGARVRVLVGSAFGATSPVDAASTTLYLDIFLAPRATLALPPLVQEMAVYPVEGDLHVDGAAVAAHAMAVLVPGRDAVLAAGDAPVRCVVVGGDALDAKRLLWWNFVARTKERVAQAADAWEAMDPAQGMQQVPGETEFIPLPPRRF